MAAPLDNPVTRLDDRRDASRRAAAKRDPSQPTAAARDASRIDRHATRRAQLEDPIRRSTHA